MTTGMTFKEAPVSRGVPTMTPITFLAGVVGSDIHHSDAFQASFVLQELLQFPEGPLMHPSIVLCGLPDIGQVLHYQHVSFGQGSNDSLGNVVIDPSHKPFPRTAGFLQFTFRGTCAFGLEFGHQAFPSDSLLFHTAEEVGLTGHCQGIHSQVNTQYFTVVVTAGMDIGLCGEGKAEEEPTFIILDQGALSQFPTEIFLKYLRESYLKFHPSLECRQRKHRPFLSYGSASGKIISDRQFFRDFRFGTCLLDHFYSLGNGINHQLCLKTKALFNFIVTLSLKLCLRLNLMLPGGINTKLNCLSIDPHGVIEELGTIKKFDFSGDHDFHNSVTVVVALFKGGKALVKVKTSLNSSPP